MYLLVYLTGLQISSTTGSWNQLVGIKTSADDPSTVHLFPGSSVQFNQCVNRVRPFNIRRIINLIPPLVFNFACSPCLVFRFLLFGWYSMPRFLPRQGWALLNTAAGLYRSKGFTVCCWYTQGFAPLTCKGLAIGDMVSTGRLTAV